MSDEEFSTQRWVYEGRHWSAVHGWHHIWLDHEGERRIYKAVKATALGGIYDVVCSESKVRGEPVFTGEKVDQERCQVIYASVTEAQRNKRLHDYEKKLETEDIDRAVTAMKPLLRECRSYEEARRVSSLVTLRATDAWLKMKEGKQ